MVDPSVDTTGLQAWFEDNLIALVLIAVFLVLLHAFQNRVVGLVVARFVATQAQLVAEGGADPIELQKRSVTLESLVRTVLRVSVVGIAILLIIGLLGLWGVVAGLGLVLAALTLAGQSIVLDYLMGILIIVEGQFYNGDSIKVGEIGGTVETVGLRRTVVRDPSGTVHSISNGELRIVSNRTRIFAAAEVRVRGIREADLDRVIDIMGRVGKEIAADPEFAAVVHEAPALAFIDDPDDLGNTAVMRGRVTASERWRVAVEVRRRLNQMFVAEGVELNKRGVAPRLGQSSEAALLAATVTDDTGSD